MLLPETTQTKIIFNGTLREWITTLNQRLHKTAQKEIRLVAQAIRDEFIKQCPIISEALYNFEDAEDIHIMDRLVLEKFGVYEMVKQNGFKKLKK
jgi:thymidylate synthase ThyX